MSSDKATSPEAVLRQLFMGLRASQVAYVAAKLALADHLANQPMSSTQLAAATSTDPASLRRVLRALVALGVLTETDPDAFALTPVGHLLRTDHPRSLRALGLFMTGDVRWRCWGDLLESVRTGEPATQRVLGMSKFEFYAANPEVAEIHLRHRHDGDYAWVEASVKGRGVEGIACSPNKWLQLPGQLVTPFACAKGGPSCLAAEPGC